MAGFTLLFTWHLQTWHTCQCWFGSWGDFLKGSYFEISLHAILCSLCVWRVGWCWEGAGHLEMSLCLWAKLFLRSSGIFHLQRFQVQAFLVRRCGSFRKLLNLSLPTYKMGILPTPAPMGIEMLCGIVLGVRSPEAHSGDTIPNSDTCVNLGKFSSYSALVSSSVQWRFSIHHIGLSWEFKESLQVKNVAQCLAHNCLENASNCYCLWFLLFCKAFGYYRK